MGVGECTIKKGFAHLQTSFFTYFLDFKKNVLRVRCSHAKTIGGVCRDIDRVCFV